MRLVFATYNNNKVKEIKAEINNPSIQLFSLEEINYKGELPENQSTLSGNAIEKATHIYTNLHCNCFSDDSGLEVEELNDEPGVFSARYAGPQKNDSDNVEKLLAELQNKENRKARFTTVICLLLEAKSYLFEGIINGVITQEKLGNNGFGYDPVFIPEGYSQTFAQMSLEEKNKVSHRTIAVRKLSDFLNKL